MTLIGRRCTGGDAFSRARLIARTLSGGAFAPRLPSGPVPVPLLSAAIVSADNVIEAATARRLHPFPFRTGQARRLHPFPFRTGQLSSGAPMVLRKRESRSPPSSPPGGFRQKGALPEFVFLHALPILYSRHSPIGFLFLLFPSFSRFGIPQGFSLFPPASASGGGRDAGETRREKTDEQRCYTE